MFREYLNENNPNNSNESNREESKRRESGITRREFFDRFIDVLAGITIGYSFRRVFELPHEREMRFYRSGEIILNHITPIEIRGWRLIFNRKQVENYYQKFPNRNFSFTLINPNVSKSPEIGSFGAFEVGGDHRNYWEMVGLPPGRNKIIYLHFQESEIINGKERIIFNKVYPITLTFYTYKPRKKEKYEIIRIYSEIPLPEDQLKELHQLHEAFERFGLPSTVYIFEVKEENLRSGVNIYTEDRIELPSNIFTRPIFTNEGVMKLFHELCHGIIKIIIFNQKNQRVNIELFNTYKQLVKEAGWDIPMPAFSFFGPPEEIENNPYFSIFDESSYTKAYQDYGHPYSDYNELFASALTVFRFFPNEFVQRYNQLTDEQKKQVASVVRVIFNALESINPNHNDINNLLPQQDLLRKIYQK
jgi:hypothetical protein